MVLAELRLSDLPRIKGNFSPNPRLTERDHQAIALKITAANAGSRELDNLLKLEKIEPQIPCHRYLPKLLDHFEHTQSSFTHTCLVLELLGESVKTFCRRFFPLNKLPPGLNKIVARQMISLLDFLHNVCQFVHSGNPALFAANRP